MTTRGTNAKGVVNQYQNHIKTVMANSTLDEGQKYRLTKRLTADLDLHIVTHNFSVVAKKIEAAFDRKPFNSEMVYDLRRERMIIAREVTFFRWTACKLYLSAPLGEVAFSERGARIIGLIWHEILAPLGRFLGRMLGWIFFFL